MEREAGKARLGMAVAWLDTRLGPAHRAVDALECVLSDLLAILTPT